MAEGIWKMTDTGEFELAEPYRTQLEECKVAATRAWHAAAIAYLAEHSPYTAQELSDELVKRNREREDGKVVVFDEFILEALSGDL